MNPVLSHGARIYPVLSHEPRITMAFVSSMCPVSTAFCRVFSRGLRICHGPCIEPWTPYLANSRWLAGWLPGCVILYWLGTSSGARTARAFQLVPEVEEGAKDPVFSCGPSI